MWEPEFANKELWKQESEIKHHIRTNIQTSDISSSLLVYWREHCLECAPPECYHTCSLYDQREDKRCIRVCYGIFPNPAFKGLYEFGADVRFKRWAKLGTSLYPVMLNPRQHRFFQNLDSFTAKVVRSLFRFTNRYNPNEWLNIKYKNPQRLIHKTYAHIREKVIRSICKHNSVPIHIDNFLMECYSLSEQTYRMQIEFTGKSSVYRDSIIINPGLNTIEIPFQKFGSTSFQKESLIVYPENDLDVRVVFTWLDFVQYVTTHKQKTISPSAEKVKCVAWDLDNTLWKGILIEDGADNITIPEKNIQLLKELDHRGIIQTIVSKNDFDEAWKILEHFGIQDYFIYPAINWSPKSLNLKKIAEKINIGIDTFALIDDSPFERAEVKTLFPQIRTYSDMEIDSLLSNIEFDVPATETGKLRRLSYLNQIQREKVKEQFGNDITAFLKSCDMKMHIFTPIDQKQIERCLELIQRSNQLNLSSRRYSAEEFATLLNDKDYYCTAFRCSDRFGDYGIVGFASVYEKSEIPDLHDFVISCRVAQKRVEHAFIEWLAVRERNRGCNELFIKIIKTRKNGPLTGVFKELPFLQTEETNEKISFSLDLKLTLNFNTTITIIDETGKGSRVC